MMMVLPAHSLTLACRFLLLLLPVALAFDVLHESDSTPPTRFQQLTLQSEHDDHRQSPILHRPIPDHGDIAWLHKIQPLEELRYALDVMQDRYFEVSVGTWPTAIDWTRAVLDTYLISTLNTLSRVVAKTGHGPYRTDDVDLIEIDNDINKYFTQNVSLDLLSTSHTHYFVGLNTLDLRDVLS